MKPAFVRAAWLVLLALPAVEVGAHAATRLRVPERADWQTAARYVRGALRLKDAITSAPGWTDPLLRRELGDRIDLAMAGRSDLAGYERLWALSIRGARPREALGRKPVLEKSFGRVRVLRWDLGPSAVRYDFAAHVRQAQVSFGPSDQATPCPWQHFLEPRGGGLGFGVLPPVERFQCRRGVWVAPVVLEDLDLQPRHCIYQPPGDRGPLRVRFEQVPFADRVVFFGGLYYEHERMRDGVPVDIRLLRDGSELGRMTHRDGEGWRRWSLRTSPGPGAFEVEVSAKSAHRRSFCWAASVRQGRQERVP